MTETRRRGFPWWLLLVAFVVVPLVEIYVIIQIGQVIGAWWTILLLIADSILGSWLVKREGRRAWRALQAALQQGRMPGRELADGVLILVGGTLMLTPGFVTDAVGILCLLPVTRPLGRRALAGVINRRLVGVTFPDVSGNGHAAPGQRPGPEFGPEFGPGFGRDPRAQHRPGPVSPDNGVVQGEVVDERPGEGGSRPADASASDSGLLLAGAGAVQVRRADLAAPQQFEALGEDVLELLDRAPLEQHVPVGAGRLLGLHLGLDA